jgi:FdhD protein
MALVVSGRVSFEIVQKAAVAGFELLIGVSAPTSLGIETARQFGLTLVAFSRGESFNVYAGSDRLLSEA